ncbi:MAG TPA: hypothetical protein VK582_12310 [Pyrinomonadaceae bacterium]|nr:hypothetical protein [Pyrinomonadaceae bacterium]
MKPILLYLILVGLPILGIFGLLRAGQKLSAPISLSGTWSTQLDLESLPCSSVRDPRIHPGLTTLSITQSGPHVFLTFDNIRKTTLTGNVQDLMIYASFIPEGADQASTSGSVPTAIYFHGTVDRQTAPNRLLGVLSFNCGPVQTEVPLTALRHGEGRKPTGGH